MEEYENMENDAPDALDATTAIARRDEYEARHQSMDTASQPEEEVEKNYLSNLGALKATSGNGAKRLKARQETRMATRASKNA